MNLPQSMREVIERGPPLGSAGDICHVLIQFGKQRLKLPHRL